MTDLTSALVASSKQWAQPIAAAYASGNRVYHVLVTRPGDPGTFDRNTGQWVGRTTTTVYDGQARIWVDEGTGLREEGDEQIPFNDIRLSIDHSDPMPRVDDALHVVDDAQSASTQLAGRDFEITGVEIGGHFDTGVTLSATGAAPSRHNP